MQSDSKKTYITRVQELFKKKELVEIIDDNNRELTGYITEVGEDYLGITWSLEREVVKHVPKESGEGTKPEKSVVVMELETFLLFADIKALSRIKKQATK